MTLAAKLREGTEILRTGGGATLTSRECDQLLDVLSAVGAETVANDYCVVCDCHPSSGHSKGCALNLIGGA